MKISDIVVKDEMSTWRRSSEESNQSSTEFDISAFNDLFPSRARRAASIQQAAAPPAAEEVVYVGKKKCPPWKEVEDGLESGKYTKRRMNLDHDLYDRVEKICEDGEPQFYHCLRCNALLRFNSGGSYRRHFAICKADEEDGEEADEGAPNDHELTGGEISPWTNGSSRTTATATATAADEPNGTPARNTRSRVDRPPAKQNGGAYAAASTPSGTNGSVNGGGGERDEPTARRKFAARLVDWAIAELIPVDVVDSPAFRRLMDDHAEWVECQQRGAQPFNFEKLLRHTNSASFPQEVEAICAQRAEDARRSAVEHVNRNGCSLMAEFATIEGQTFDLLTVYFFRKEDDKWILDSQVVDFAKWDGTKERTAENFRAYVTNAMRKFGATEAIVESVLLTLPLDDFHPFGSENTVLCISSLLQTIARRICGQDGRELSEKLCAQFTPQQLGGWRAIPGLFAELEFFADFALADARLVELLHLRPAGKAANGAEANGKPNGSAAPPARQPLDFAHWLRQMDVLGAFLDKEEETYEYVKLLVDKQHAGADEVMTRIENLAANHSLLVDLFTVLKLLAKPARAQQVDDVPTLGRTIPILSRMVIDLRKFAALRDHNAALFAAVALDVLDGSLAKIRTGVEGIAAFLDPNSRRILKVAQQQMGKGAWCYDEIKDAVRKAAQSLELQREDVEAAPKTETNGNSDEPQRKKPKIELTSPTKTSSLDADLLYGFDVRDCQPEIEQELGDYEAIPIRGHVDVGRFWAERAEAFPKLSQLAARFLSAQASTVKATRGFDIRSAVELQRRSAASSSQIVAQLNARRVLRNRKED